LQAKWGSVGFVDEVPWEKGETMPVLLVSYQLKNSDHDYGTFQDMLLSYPGKRVNKSTILLETQDSPQEFFDGIWPFIDAQDSVFVFRLGKDCCIQGDESVQQWVNDHLN
jgi:hypothetical protein